MPGVAHANRRGQRTVGQKKKQLMTHILETQTGEGQGTGGQKKKQLMTHILETQWNNQNVFLVRSLGGSKRNQCEKTSSRRCENMQKIDVIIKIQ